MRASLDADEFPSSLAAVQSVANLGVTNLTHATTERCGKNFSLVGYRFSLEKAFSSVGDGLFRVGTALLAPLLLLASLAGGSNYLPRLVPELGGQLFMCGKDLFGSERLLPVSRGMRRDLRRLGAAVPGLFQLLPDLL